MKIESSYKNIIPFLQGGGEMGALTRKHNWSETSLGTPDQWPQSLLIALSMVLKSKFPMLLYWGEEMNVFYNDAFRPSFGDNGKHPQALGQPADTLWSEAWDTIKVPIRQVFAGGESTLTEDQAITTFRNGRMEEGYWSYSFTPVPDDAGNIGGVLVLCVETTLKVLNYKQLKVSESRFRDIIEHSSVATCMFTGRDMTISIANKIMLSYWGKGGSVLGKPLAAGVPELVGQPFLQILDEVFTTGITYEAKEARAKLELNGVLGTYYFDYTYKALRDAAGEIFGVMNTAVDVTQKVLAQRKTTESERNLRNTILQAPVAMCIFKGVDHVVEIANERMIELWGKTGTAVLERPIFDILPEIKGQGFENLLASVYNTGETVKAYGIPITLPRNGNLENVFVDFVYEAYREEDNSISGVLAVAIEVTQQVLARQKIEESEANLQLRINERTKELQRSNDDLQQFAHVASHDLKEPVRKIRFFANRLLSEFDSELAETPKLYVKKMENAVARIYAMIDGVLLYSSLNSIEQRHEEIDLDELMESIAEDLEVLIMQKNAQLNWRNLGSIEGSQPLIYQLFYNLVNNALKFSKPGVASVIEITSALADEHLDNAPQTIKISVKDNGIGFNQAQAENIFKTFIRLHSKDKFEGTGLGLTLCKKIVERHGGTIEAMGEEGTGTTITITMPLRKSSLTK